MQIGDLIRRAGRRYGDSVALAVGSQTMSYRAFDEATDRVGNGLLRAGLRPGDRVSVLLPNGIEAVVAYYGIAKAGLVRVSLNHRDTHEDHVHRIADSGSRALISAGDRHDVEYAFDLDALTAMIASGDGTPCDIPFDPEAPYRLGYTGGTTGPSKAVTLTLRSEHAEITNYLLEYVPGIRPGDVMLHAAPITHASGSFFLPHLIRGGRNEMLPSFDPGTYLEAFERMRPARTFLVPTMIAMLLDVPNVRDLDASELNRLCYGASPIAPTVADTAQEIFGRVLTQTYGQAEAPMTLSLLRPDEHDRHGSAGRAYEMVEVRVHDEDDRPVAAGETGEVVARGQIVMSGYWNRPEETARTMRGGWLHTGDVGTMDEDGFLYLKDRKHDVIISGGFNIYPREIEEVLVAHPAVREAAIVGLPDERWGETVHAVVSVREPVLDSDLLDFVKQRVAGYKRPRSLEIWDDLPTSSAGKVLRRTVRDDVASPGRDT